MPNLALVDYVVTGNDKHLDKIYQTMKDLQEMKESFIENYYGITWLGNLIAKLGGDPMKMDCRGEWTHISREDFGLAISMETAWGELDEVRTFLENTFPNLKIYYYSETDETRWTNDRDGRFFDDRYYIYTDENGSKCFRYLPELIEEIESVTGTSGLKTLEDCKAEIDRHYEHKIQEDERYVAYLIEYTVVD